MTPRHRGGALAGSLLQVLLHALLWGALLLAGGCARVGVEPPLDLPPPSTERPPPEEVEPPAPPDATPPARPLPPEDRACPGVGCPGPALPEDVRALWVVRTSLVHPDTARAVVRRAAIAGFNTLLVQVRGRGDAWFPSELEPRPVQQSALPDPASGPPWASDPLAALLDEARMHGISVHGWLNMGLVASAHSLPVDPHHPALRFPEALAVPRELASDLFGMDPRDPTYLGTLAAWSRANEDRVEGIYQSPVDPRVRRHLVSVVADLAARYPLDGIHLDYLRFPAPDFDHSRGTLEAFRDAMLADPEWGRAQGDATRRAQAEMAWPEAPSAWVDAFPDAWADFLAGELTGLLRDIHVAVRRERPGLLLSAAVFADRSDARRARFQPWDDWMDSGLLDVVVPMAYTTDETRWARQVEDAVHVAGRHRVWAGVGIWQTTLESAVSRVRGMREAPGGGPAGMALFSYDWAVGPEGEARAGEPWLDAFGRRLWGLSVP